jgi:hypothetical protein
MNSAICTLFEGDYHYGLGALANSLYARGFRGTIYAGYRGPLPPWVAVANEVNGFTDFSPADGLTLRFIPLTTKVHLTNYKPDFMLEVWEKHCPQAGNLFYFDPDITVKCRWTFFEEWAQSGVALCEDVNSPMPSSHPVRNAWRNYYGKLGRKLKNSLDMYVNGGFVGVAREQKKFIEEWNQIQQEMSPSAGNLMDWGLQDRTFKFCFTDQDALNITLMDTAMPFSLSGKDGMDIVHMGYLMSHALGGRKPWRRSYLWERLSLGFAPVSADKFFWANASQPIAVMGTVCRILRVVDLKAAAAFERIF